MVYRFEIKSKAAIYVHLDKMGAMAFAQDIQMAKNQSRLEIVLDNVLSYRGKKVSIICFIKAEDEFVFRAEDGRLCLALSEEAIEDLSWYLNNAIVNNGFLTPELMNFYPRSSKDVEVTLYGMWNG